ncbi:CRISPR-associated protein Cas4 [bacterium]|nr:CRISPR-associated protein Cas4 [bacterium]MCP5463054.1 CRISPR-associated protein Cas4 [bacterium]
MDSFKLRDWDDSQIIPISALEHYLYCPRQCALIHNEGIFSDNVLTVSGKLEHQRVDEVQCLYEHNARRETSFPVFSHVHGITGIVDVVEFLHDGTIFPVDHKHGKKIVWHQAAVQLCAYTLCLEEMFHVSIHKGAIYHTSSKKRSEVSMTEQLRAKTSKAIIETRNLMASKCLPQPHYGAICKDCSLIHDCMPELDNSVYYKNIYKVNDND